MSENLLISLFDYTGNASEPYRKAGWNIIQVDVKLGIDVFIWNYKSDIEKYRYSDHHKPIVGIIAMIPCTDYANSGAKHFKEKDSDGRTIESQKLVARTKEILDYCWYSTLLKFWQVENPMSRIHKLNPWLGKVKLKFDPCDYAGYDPVPDNSRYNKKTWLWGNFNIPDKKYIEPIRKENPGWKNLGGKSERTKELRSITPLGFAYAFYEFNH
jgi:hypothetical protein